MLLVWVAYTFFYTTVLWFHLNAPYISTDDFIPALTETSASAPIPIPTPPIIVPISPRIPIPDTIIFPASPLPTARLLHKALPLCHDGLHDELPRFAGTRTSRAKTESVVNSPSLRMRHPLVALNLASALGHSLAHGIVGLALVFVSGLVCVSWVLFMVRRTVFVVAAPHSRTVCHCSCSLDEDQNARVVALSATKSSPNDAPSSPFELATMSPALTKSERLIARVKRRKPVLAKGAPMAPQIDPPPLVYSPPPPPPLLSSPAPHNSPPETVEMDTHVWSIDDGSTVECIPPVQRCKTRTSPVGFGLTALD